MSFSQYAPSSCSINQHSCTIFETYKDFTRIDFFLEPNDDGRFLLTPKLIIKTEKMRLDYRDDLIARNNEN